MNIEQARINMLGQQLRTWDVLDQHVLDIMGSTPREDFVPPIYRNEAYADMAIPLDHSQIMFTPKEEARLLQALAIKPTESVLEIGTGSGYMTALLARLARQVYSVDIFADFTEQARQKLRALTLSNIELWTGDAAHGWVQKAPYDVIIITGSMYALPASFRNCLKPGGRLVVILGEAPAMEAMLIARDKNNQWSEASLFETVVPALINAVEPPAFVF